MRKPSLKNRKPSVYIFFALSILMSLFIFAESATPGSASARQSNFFGAIFANVINLFSHEEEAKEVEPLALSLANDSSYLGKKEEIAQVGIGTTTRLSFSLESPKLEKGEYLNPSFMVTRDDGTKEEDGIYKIITDVDSHTIYLVSVGVSFNGLAITVKAGKEATYRYRFDIVDLPSAPNDLIKCDPILPITLKVNESYQIPFWLDDGKKHDPYVVDEYLRRYFDIGKIPSSSDKEEVATVDKRGVIHPLKEGETTVNFGPISFKVTVKGEAVLPSSSSEIKISKDEGFLSLNDYDYAKSGVKLSAQYEGVNPDDGSFSFEVVDINGKEDFLSGKIIRTSPSSCVVKGYRKAGKTYVKVISNANPSLFKTIEFQYSEIKPVSMKLMNSKGEFLTDDKNHNGDIVVLSASNSSKLSLRAIFQGENGSDNVTDTSIHVETSSTNIVVSGNDSRIVTLSFVGVGAAMAKVSSSSNPSLFYELSFSISKVLGQDPTDTSFLSFVRKFVGHALLCGVNGILIFVFLVLLLEDKKGYLSLGISLGTSFVMGALSELIQLWTPDRFGTFKDVFFDGLGSLIAIAIAFLGYTIIKFWKNKKKRDKAI